MSRLDNLPTLRINPEQRIPFNYAGKSYQGLAGDTIAAALYANGTRVFSSSSVSSNQFSSPRPSARIRSTSAYN